MLRSWYPWNALSGGGYVVSFVIQVRTAVENFIFVQFIPKIVLYSAPSHIPVCIADPMAVSGLVACHDDGHNVLLLAHLHVSATRSPQRDYEATHGAQRLAGHTRPALCRALPCR